MQRLFERSGSEIVLPNFIITPEIKNGKDNSPSTLVGIEMPLGDGSVDQLIHFQNFAYDASSNKDCLEVAARAAMFQTWGDIKVRLGYPVDKKVSSPELGVRILDEGFGMYVPRAQFTAFCLLNMSFFMNGKESIARWVDSRIKTAEDQKLFTDNIVDAYKGIPRPYFQHRLPGF